MPELSTLNYILIFTFIGSVLALAGGFLLLANKKIALKISHFLASFAAGALLSTAFLELLPEAAHEAEALELNIFLWALGGIIIFFLLERFIHWFHHHGEYHEKHSEVSQSTVPLIVIGDTMHNFIDGVIIAATFLVSVPLGIGASIAVFAHELPQEIGDFGLLLHKGLKRSKIIVINIISASFAFLGAIITYVLGGSIENFLPIALAITAGFFIYIAASDLIPEINHEKRKGYAFWETIFLILGVLFVFLSTSFLEHGN